VITDASGNIEQQYSYFPYGGLIASTGTDPNHYKFTGKERDTESGLDEFGARYYGSSFGRFLTPDWAAKPTAVPYASFGNPQSLNLYSYVNNNPTTTRDPDGHKQISNSGGCNDPMNPDPCVYGLDDGGANTLNAPTPPSAQNAAPVATYDPNKPLYTPNGVVYGASGNTSNAIYKAFALGAQYGEESIGADDREAVLVRHVGFTDNVQIPGDTLDKSKASENGWEDPLTSFHGGAESYYFGNRFFDTGHVAAGAGKDADPGLEAHYDRLGPLNPLHWVEAALSLVINTRNSAVARPYTCSLSGGCAAQ
jgi:RHS repeat-associated protein